MIEKNILFSVGPVEMYSETLKIGGDKLPYFRTDEFSKINKNVSRLMKKLCYTDNSSECITLTASGTAAMEASVINIFGSKDKLLVVSGGSFGDRFKKICDIYDIDYTLIKLNQGQTLTEDILYKYKDKGYTGLLINAHETSTGVLYNLDFIGEFCKEQGIIFVVDSISSFLADEYYMDKWNIDVTIISSQKALSLPPGLSFIILNKNMINRIYKNQVKSLYFDLKIYLDNVKRGQTPFTPAVGLILQLNNRLNSIDEYGVNNIIKNTRLLAEDFRKKIVDLPFEISSENLSNTLTPIEPLGGIKAYDLYLYLKNKHGLILCPSGGILRDKLLRVGHIGNLTIEDNKRLISVLYNMKKEGLL